MSTEAGGAPSPLISVVMPVYDGERYVADAVRSIQEQSYPHWELVVIDDGSSDSSLAVVRELAAGDERIHVHPIPHGGIGRALNAGVARARGELIAIQSADDVALPERLSAQLEWMQRTGVEICGCWVKRFGADDRVLWFPETHEAIRHELVFRAAVFGAVLMKAEIARAHPYDEDGYFEDYGLLTRVAPLHRMGNVPAVLYGYRAHSRQSRVVHAPESERDLRGIRRRYFDSLFPDAHARDAETVERVAAGEPLRSLAELRLAGAWLARLADCPDPLLRRRMLARWRTACRRSAPLGPGVFRLYRRVAREFAVAPPESAFPVWLACALRLRWNSRLDRMLVGLRDAVA